MELFTAVPFNPTVVFSIQACFINPSIFVPLLVLISIETMHLLINCILPNQILYKSINLISWLLSTFLPIPKCVLYLQNIRSTKSRKGHFILGLLNSSIEMKCQARKTATKSFYCSIAASNEKVLQWWRWKIFQFQKVSKDWWCKLIKYHHKYLLLYRKYLTKKWANKAQ